jgi:hypothetical protein
VATQATCAAADGCVKDGKCDVVDGHCAALKSADCRRSLRCRLEGTCTAEDGECVAASSGDCLASSNCKAVNRCTAKEGTCVSSGKPAKGGQDETTSGHVKTTVGGLFGL